MINLVQKEKWVAGPAKELPDSDLSFESDSSGEKKKYLSDLASRNKHHLFEWLINADFTQEISLAELATHPFALNSDENSIVLDP